MAEVTVPFGDEPSETATLLLAAADELDQEPGVVRTTSGAFLVEEDLAKKAGVDYDKPDEEPEPEQEQESKPKKSSRR